MEKSISEVIITSGTHSKKKGNNTLIEVYKFETGIIILHTFENKTIKKQDKYNSYIQKHQ